MLVQMLRLAIPSVTRRATVYVARRHFARLPAVSCRLSDETAPYVPGWVLAMFKRRQAVSFCRLVKHEALPTLFVS